MRIHVEYANDYRGEYAKYVTTDAGLLDTFQNGCDPEVNENMLANLRDSGTVQFQNGYALVTLKASHALSPECSCTECVEIDWDAPCENCNFGSIAGRLQRDCCGCHESEHYDDCESGIEEARFLTESEATDTHSGG